MIERGNKVKYISRVSEKYVGQSGTVISDPYQLSAVQDTFFVDVEWSSDYKTAKDTLKNTQLGHVVNIENLMVIG